MGVGAALSTIAGGVYMGMCTPVGLFASSAAIGISGPYLYFKHFRPGGAYREAMKGWTMSSIAPEALLGASLYASFTLYPPLPKFLGFVSYSIISSPFGRGATALLSALGTAHLYYSHRQTNKLSDKWADLSWSKLLPEGMAITAFIASISIFKPGFLFTQLTGIDATFAGLPYKLISLVSSGISSAGSFVLTQILDTKATYLANPLKIVDWIVYKGAENLVHWTKTYITELQRQKDLYGYGGEEREKNLSGIELYNIDLQSLKLLGFSLPINAGFIRSMVWVFGYLNTPVAYLNSGIKMVGLTPVSNVIDVMASTAFSTTGLTAGSILINTASIGISIVTQWRLADGWFSTYNANYQKAIDEQKKAAQELEEKFAKIGSMIRKKEDLLTDKDKQNNMLLSALYQSFTSNPEIKHIMLIFSKFKDKSKSDYIYAFAIKLLENGRAITPEQFKLLMMSVIMSKTNFNNYMAHLIDPEKTPIATKIPENGGNDKTKDEYKAAFTQHAITMDNYLTDALNNLSIKTKRAGIVTAEMPMDNPVGIFVTKREDLRDEREAVPAGEEAPETPKGISELGEAFLKKLDNAAGVGKGQAAAVQVLLQKVNAIEKEAPDMMESIINIIKDPISFFTGRG